MENLKVTDINFQTKIKTLTGIVLFYKNLCPNCKALEKMIDKFLLANSDVDYLRIDSEVCPEAMKAFDTTRVPTIILLREGKTVAKKVGLMNLREMAELYRSV